jgi:hypothetical protein
MHATIHPENVSTSIPQLRHSNPNCCTSNVNPSSRLRGNDEAVLQNLTF